MALTKNIIFENIIEMKLSGHMRHTYLDIQKTNRNPAYYHCFTDEDFCGRVARASATLHRTTAMRRVLERYLDMLLRRWNGSSDILGDDPVVDDPRLLVRAHSSLRLCPFLF